METNSSGENLFVKQTRKPYTIKKQRKKWTEKEHSRFIEALKLHGRAWQRIAEHIGTKTAVQIRSHAQKFFTKANEHSNCGLEKEAITLRVPFGQARDIEIPPPRPKRKPGGPYPRKTGAGSLSLAVDAIEEKTLKSPSPSITCKQAVDIENDAAWKIQGAKDNSEDGGWSDVLNPLQDAPAASISSLSKGSSSLSDYNGSMPLKKAMSEKITLKGSSISLEVNNDMKGNGSVNANHGSGELKRTCFSFEMKSAQDQPEKIVSVMDNLQGDQKYRKHVPIDSMKRSGDENVPTATDGRQSLNDTNPSTSEMYTDSGLSPLRQSFPAFPPFTHLPRNPDACQPLHSIPSTFSSLVVSGLLQNPAVHVAACMASSFCPFAGMNASVDLPSETVSGGVPIGHTRNSPSMGPIAAATVAAASAWWATQGLLPICPPPHTGFAFAPEPTTTTQTVDTTRAPGNRKKEKGRQYMDPEQPEALRARHT